MSNILSTFQVHLCTTTEDSVWFRAQAVDSDHAKEQALNAYPDGLIISVKPLPMFLAGSTVWWRDPDNGLSSGRYQVRKIMTESGEIEDEDDLVFLVNESGSEVEALAHELGPVPSVADLASDVLNSESDEGCDSGYTVVHQTRLLNLVSEIQLSEGKVDSRVDDAATFHRQLIDSVETLSGLADRYGAHVLADLMYLQHAILTGGHVSVYDQEAKDVLAIVDALPSGKKWRNFVREEA